MDPKVVVVVEPWSLERGEIARQLTAFGWPDRVVPLEDGLAALEYIFATGRFHGEIPREPGAVLLAVDAPVLGGLEVARRLRASRRMSTLPIGLLAVTTTRQLERAASELDAVVLTLPLDRERLLDLLPEGRPGIEG